MQTVVAIFKALKAFYLLILVMGLVVFLFPEAGNRVSDQIGSDQLLRLGVALALFAGLYEHLRTSTLGRRLAYVARGLVRISPEARKLEAVKILVQALRSDNEEVVSSAHVELKRLTGQDFGTNVREWRQWMRRQELGSGQPGTGEPAEKTVDKNL